jgi:hypothetical protein
MCHEACSKPTAASAKMVHVYPSIGVERALAAPKELMVTPTGVMVRKHYRHPLVHPTFENRRRSIGRCELSKYAIQEFGFADFSRSSMLFT